MKRQADLLRAYGRQPTERIFTSKVLYHCVEMMRNYLDNNFVMEHIYTFVIYMAEIQYWRINFWNRSICDYHMRS